MVKGGHWRVVEERCLLRNFLQIILAGNIHSPQLMLRCFLSCRCIGNVQFKELWFFEGESYVTVTLQLWCTV